MTIGFNEVRNGSSLTLNDISSEEWREYDYGKQQIRINGPVALNVSKSGGHRVVDENEVTHYIPKGWIHLSWKAKDGQPHLVM